MRCGDGGCADSRELDTASTSALATLHMITRILNVGSVIATLIARRRCPEEDIPLQRAPALWTIIIGNPQLPRSMAEGPEDRKGL